MQGRRTHLHLEDDQHQVRRKCQISVKRIRKLHNIEAFKEADTVYLRRIAAKPHRICLNGMVAFYSRRQRHHKT